MIVTIVGAGTVGSHLARYLSGEHVDIYIIDRDPSRLELLDAEYNLMAIAGDAIEPAILRQGKVSECDLFIAVTEVPERNFVACAMAKSMGAKMTVARADRYDYLLPHNLEVVQQMGVDNVICPDYLVAQGVIDSLRHSWVNYWYEFNHGEMVLMGVRLPASAPIVGKKLRELAAPGRFYHIAAIRREHITMIPKGGHTLMADDMLYIAVTSQHLQDVVELTGCEPRKIRRVVISGGSDVATLMLRLASDEYRFTIIEGDQARCNAIISTYHDCEVINGEATDSDILAEAGMGMADAFVALTQSAAENILTCLSANDYQVVKTVAEVNLNQFVNMAESFKIGTILNKQWLMANAIYQLLIDAGSSSPKRLAIPDAEVVVFEIKQGSKLSASTVSELKIPEEVTFAGLVRDGKCQMVTGATQFQPGDKVLVMCLAGALSRAKKFFN
ncbi:MAG: Trk system potassium transporter TrkA [Muribaculaceae bacterium]|nr:Trk system potassium transporter TrkA [Muribaculaceae bacterium]